jgi:hypothetical protein
MNIDKKEMLESLHEIFNLEKLQENYEEVNRFYEVISMIITTMNDHKIEIPNISNFDTDSKLHHIEAILSIVRLFKKDLNDKNYIKKLNLLIKTKKLILKINKLLKGYKNEK